MGLVQPFSGSGVSQRKAAARAEFLLRQGHTSAAEVNPADDVGGGSSGNGGGDVNISDAQEVNMVEAAGASGGARLDKSGKKKERKSAGKKLKKDEVEITCSRSLPIADVLRRLKVYIKPFAPPLPPFASFNPVQAQPRSLRQM